MRRPLALCLTGSLSLVMAVLATLAGPTTVSAQKGKTATYVLQVPLTPNGFTRATVTAINDRHEIVGTAGVSSSPRAVYWSSADAAPVLLPCPADPCQNSAQGISGTGVIAGTANNLAVLWRSNGVSWVVDPLPFPGSGNPDYRSLASHVLDDGTAVGSYALFAGIMYPNEIPVRWYPSGALTEFPTPDGFFAGRALRINENGDAVGEVRTNDGTDPTYIYGVIWIQDGSGYQALVSTAALNGITPRFADGSFLVSSSAGRIRVSPSASGWTYAVESAAGGPGGGINKLGDMAGFLPKKGWMGYGGVPCLFRMDGTQVNLPLPSGATGAAKSVSTDRWVGGDFLKQGVYYPAVWRPQ